MSSESPLLLLENLHLAVVTDCPNHVSTMGLGLPGSGLDATIAHHSNGVVTYSHYVNGSIFSVPKIIHSKAEVSVVVKPADNLVASVYELVKSFFG
jgi:hypothetical protein